MSEALAACEGALMDTRIYSCFIYNNFFKIIFSNFCLVCYYFISYYTNLIK